MFKLKNSPYPDLYVRDYPENATALSFLEKVWNYHTDSNVRTAMPQTMLNAIVLKMEHTRKTLRQLKDGSEYNNEFFTFPVC
jgi:hypothetical protein